MRRILVLVLLVLLALPTPSASADHRRNGGVRCRDGMDRAYATQDALGLSGVYSVPRREPRELVVFAHGYRKPATVYWQDHLRRTADRGAVAVAMDYTGIGPAPDHRGWDVRAGAADTIAATQRFLERCRRIRTVILMGVSMGAGAAGLALAEGATRRDGSPLFDWWINVEGATNVTETYLAARLLGPADPYIAGAREDIEAEMGGPIEAVPERYAEASIVTRADDIAAAGLRGASIVHGLEDGLVPYDQSREMAAALAEAGVPYDFTTVLTRGEGEDGTTISGHVLHRAGLMSPMAGHGGEEDITHLVVAIGFERLWALLEGEEPGPAREFLADGILGTHRIV